MKKGKAGKQGTGPGNGLAVFKQERALTPDDSLGAERKFHFWRLNRKIDGLNAQTRGLCEHIIKLNSALIEALLFIEAGQHNKPNPERQARVVSQLRGILAAQAPLLDELMAQGIEIHPLLTMMATGMEAHAPSVITAQAEAKELPEPKREGKANERK